MMNENKVRLGKRITPSSNNLMAYLSCGTLCLPHCQCSSDQTNFATYDWNHQRLDALIVNSR